MVLSMWSTGGGYKNGTTTTRRRAERHAVETLSCSLGRVVDLSATGMRLACADKPPVQVGQTGKVTLSSPGGSLQVNGRIVWLRRVGGLTSKKHEMGVEFVRLAPGTTEAIDSLIRFGFFNAPSADGKLKWKRRTKTRRVIKASFDLPNYYQILHLGPDAAAEDIKKAYRRLAKQHHPDATGGQGDTAQFTLITEAYNVLIDPDRRAAFDARAIEEIEE